MRKFLIFLLSVSLISAVAVLSSNSVSADHQEDVLGVASAPSLSIPPTSGGPGLVLPDSPLFFLDRIKQEFRLLLAFTPEQKAKIHNAVAGERLAELQLMLAKNNVSGIRTALQGVSDNLKGASNDLDNAKLTGRNINLLAKEINDSIKEKQETLSSLEAQATGEIKAQVAAAKEALKIAKVSIEEKLPADLLLSETIDDLNQEIGDNVNKAKVSAVGINRAIGVLTKLASEAAVKNQPARQEALTQAKKAADKIGEATQNLQGIQDAVVLPQQTFLLKLGAVTPQQDYKISVYLNWSEVPGAVKYNVYLKNSQDQDYGGAIAGVGGFSYTASVNKNLDNYFKVQACKTSGQCIESNEVFLFKEQQAQQTFLLKLGVVTPQADPKVNVYLNWSEVSGTVKYNIYLRNSKSEEYGAAIASTGEPGYTAGVNKHLDNYFIVKACKSADVCSTSSEVFLLKQ